MFKMLEKYRKQAMRAILGKKIEMTRIFDKTGNQVPVTLVCFEPNVITQIKTKKKDGYAAIQVGGGNKKRLKKPEIGHLKKVKTDLKPRKYFEIKTEENIPLGQELNLEQFKEGEKVSVTAISKGKGFSGTVKRHHFHLGPRTHGSNNYRQPGSIGATYPERVIKGRRMAGHLGAQRTTITNLEVVKINLEKKEILLKGAVPGARESFVLIWSRK